MSKSKKLTAEAHAEKQAEKQFTDCVQQIQEADSRQVEAQLEIARLLGAMREFKLYKPMRKSFLDMTNQDLPFGIAIANQYCSLYQQYTTLKYGREEFHLLMSEFGWRKVQQALFGSTKKMGKRAIAKRLEELKETRYRQYHIEFKSQTIANKFGKLLEQYGMQKRENGRFSGASAAIENMTAEHIKLQKRVAELERKAGVRSTAKAKLKSVA